MAPGSLGWLISALGYGLKVHGPEHPVGRLETVGVALHEVEHFAPGEHAAEHDVLAARRNLRRSRELS